MILGLFSLAMAQQHPPGATIDDALTVNITRDGLDQLGGLVAQFLPTDPILVDPVEMGDNSSFPACLADYWLSVTNVQVDLDIVSTQVVPSQDQLDIELTLNVAINSPGNPFVLDFEALCIGGDCNAHVQSFPVTVSLPVGLAIVPGPTGANVLDATIGTIGIDNGLQGDLIQLDGCLIGTINDILDFFGLNLLDFVVDFAEDFLVDEIQSQAAEIETTIEDAFAQATIEEQVDLQGVTLDILLQPGNLEIDNSGISLNIDGSVAAPIDPCVFQFDPGGSDATAGLPPGAGAEPQGTHVGVHVTDDFVNQALYAVWGSGILCQDLGADSDALPVSLDTNLLGLIGGDGFNELFPEAKPIALRTVPMVPLEASFGGSSQINMPVNDLDIRIYSELEGRQARVLSVAISPEVDLDLNFDGTTGMLAADVVLGDDYNPRISGDMLVPDGEAEVLSRFGGVLGGIIDGLVGDLLGDALAFEIPSLDGFGLADLQVESLPSVGLHATATVGPVPYTGAGCNDPAGGGCGGGGCGGSGGGGCSTSRGASFAMALLMALLIRRRRP